jgi:hypothetical protein
MKYMIIEVILTRCHTKTKNSEIDFQGEFQNLITFKGLVIQRNFEYERCSRGPTLQTW